MIRIIKEGTKRVTNCDKCGCVFSYEGEDIHRVTGANLSGITHREEIACPQCRHIIVLSSIRGV